MTPATHFIASCIICIAGVLVISGIVAMFWGLSPADMRGQREGTPRPWGLVSFALVAICVGISSFATIIKFWGRW